MAFQLNAILKFSSQGAEAALTKTKQAFSGLESGMAKTSAAMDAVGKAAAAGAAATAPLALGVGFATKTAADFEEQMSKVQAAMLGTPEEMAKITAISKRLGATTSFTAKQAGEGAELLAQAGFTTEQIVSALPGVLDAAAASGVGMAQAADIIAGQLGAFGREAKDATAVADALALVTAATNTDFTDLGEAMKYVAPIAKNAGLSLEETASSVGILSNAGVKGSVAGTALKNAILQLSKPSKAAIELFGGKGGLEEATLRTVNGVKKLLPIEAIMANAAKAVSNARNPLEATAQVAEIFGLRGSTAFGAFQSKLLETTEVTEKNIDQLRKGLAKTGDNVKIELGKAIPSLVAMRLQIAGAEGTARQMAKIRLDNLRGQVEMLSSAAEGLGLEVGGLVTGPLKEGLEGPTDFLSVMALGFQKARDGTQLTAAELDDLKTNRFGGLINSAIEFAQGFIEGFKELRDFAKQTFNDVVTFLKPILAESGLTAKEFGRIAAKVIFIGAVAAPVLAGIAVGLAVLSPIISGVGSLFGLMGSTIGVVGRIASFAFRSGKYFLDLLILGVRNFGVVGSFVARLVSGGFSFLATTLRVVGSLGGLIVRGLIFGVGLLGPVFAFLGQAAVAAFVAIKAAVVGVAIPLGVVLLKVAAIAAAIAGVIFLGDKLLRVFGFLEGPSLFDRTLDFFSDFGANVEKTFSDFTGPGSVIGKVKNFFTGDKDATVSLETDKAEGNQGAKVIDFQKAVANLAQKKDNNLKPSPSFTPPKVSPNVDQGAMLEGQLKSINTQLKIPQPSPTLSPAAFSAMSSLAEKPIDVNAQVDLSQQLMPPEVGIAPESLNQFATSANRLTEKPLKVDNTSITPNQGLPKASDVTNVGQRVTKNLGNQLTELAAVTGDAQSNVGQLANVASLAEKRPTPTVRGEPSNDDQLRNLADNVISLEAKRTSSQTRLESQLGNVKEAQVSSNEMLGNVIASSLAAKPGEEKQSAPSPGDLARTLQAIGTPAEQHNVELGKEAERSIAAATSANQTTAATLNPSYVDTSVDSQRLAAESLRQKVISSPPSEEQIVDAVRRGSATSNTTGQPSTGSVRLTGELRTQISGRDLNIILSRAMLDNAEANGRSIDPAVKRRVAQNGLIFGVSG
jgi:TP901 family phage tail tape measure protein